MLPKTESPKPSTLAEVVIKRVPSKRRSKTVQYPCGKCGSECDADTSDSIECSLCKIWFYYKCLNLVGDEYFILNERIFIVQCVTLMKKKYLPKVKLENKRHK